jgi:hypothetical protein
MDTRLTAREPKFGASLEIQVHFLVVQAGARGRPSELALPPRHGRPISSRPGMLAGPLHKKSKPPPDERNRTGESRSVRCDWFTQ